MADTITIGCFLEDIGQERFIRALVRRVAEDMGRAPDSCSFDIRNAEGGSGRAVTEYGRFVKDYARGRTLSMDVLVVAIDGNCKGAAEVTNRLSDITERNGYAGRVVYAVPDPHIEKWYMADVNACQTVLGTVQPPQCPAYKCEKGRYKRALIDAIKSTGVVPLQGGAEYAAEIAEQMNLYDAGRNDASLHRFLNDMRSVLGSP